LGIKQKKGKKKHENKKQQLRDAKAIIHGTREGRFEVVNVKPKATGGVHIEPLVRVIDEKFTDTARFKETEEGEIE
jgi:hypothetical protein